VARLTGRERDHGNRKRSGIPEELRVGRAGVICAFVLAVQGIYSLALLPLVPSLIGSHPVLLEALRGSTAALVAAGAFARIGRTTLWIALLVPVPALMMFDPFVWWAGKLWGPAAAKYLGGGGARGHRRTERAVRLIERYDSLAVVAAPFLPIPSALVYAAAGWGGMRLRRFLVLDILGALLWSGLIVGLGYAIGRSAVNVANKIGHYSLIATIVLVVVVVVVIAFRTRSPRHPEGAAADAPDGSPASERDRPGARAEPGAP
jgi:membrane protein DedA with SNARE-associated domain